MAFERKREIIRKIAEILSRDGNHLRRVPEKLKVKPLVLIAVTTTGIALEFAPLNLRGDKQIALAALRQSPFALEFVSDELLHDKEILMLAASQTYKAFELDRHYPHHIWNDPDVMACLLSQRGLLLELSPLFQEDPDMVYIAVLQDGRALEFASPFLQDDEKIVSAAINQDANALEYATSRFKDNVDTVQAAVKKDGSALAYASPRLQADKDVFAIACTSNASALFYTDPCIQEDRECVEKAVSYHGRALFFANDEFRDDKELVMTAVTQDGSALQYASKKVKADINIVIAATVTCATVHTFTPFTIPDILQYITPMKKLWSYKLISKGFNQLNLGDSEMLFPNVLNIKKRLIQKNKDTGCKEEVVVYMDDYTSNSFFRLVFEFCGFLTEENRLNMRDCLLSLNM